MSIEEWRPIACNPDFGYVSNLGRIKSRSGKIRKLQLGSNGYMRIGFQSGRTTLLVHRLVAEAFLSIDKDKKCVNHKDLCKSNNMVENLEWVTHSENTIHHFANGARGLDMRNRKLTNEQYHEALAKRKSGMTFSALSNEYGITRACFIKKLKRIEESLCL